MAACCLMHKASSPVARIAATGSTRPMLLKKSPLVSLAKFSGVFIPLTDGRERLAGRSERSIFARANGKNHEATFSTTSTQCCRSAHRRERASFGHLRPLVAEASVGGRSLSRVVGVGPESAAPHDGIAVMSRMMRGGTHVVAFMAVAIGLRRKGQAPSSGISPTKQVASWWVA